MKLFVRGLLFVFLLFSFSKCAKRGFIDGGPKDSLAPVLRYSLPENFSTNFEAKQIKIYFDEYIKLKDVAKQLIVSPPQKTKPEVIPTNASKFITIKLKDTLQANTTYSLNFGTSIQDNNESNPYEQFRYVFSTSSYIDSLMLGGSIKDAFFDKVDKNITVMLYEVNESFNDSVVFKKMPNYVTNTLDFGNQFLLENLKKGQYLLVALQDLNNNFFFNPQSEKIGFYKDFISLPNDTLYEIELFKEKMAFKPTRLFLEKNNKLVLAHEGVYEKQPIKMQFNKEWITPEISKYKDKDSLEIWFKNFETDTLRIKLDNIEFKTVFRKSEKDSLQITPDKSSMIDLGRELTLNYNIPISKINKNLITITDKDSIFQDFKIEQDSWLKKITIKWNTEENQKYNFLAMPQAFEDFLGNTHDTLNLKLTTKALSNYGNLNLELRNVKSYPVIVQLADDKGETKYEAILREPKVSFKLIEPFKYVVRFIYDENDNGVWDTGNYLEKKQSEEVLYFPERVDVRQNWDVEQAIDLGG